MSHSSLKSLPVDGKAAPAVQTAPMTQLLTPETRISLDKIFPEAVCAFPVTANLALHLQSPPPKLVAVHLDQSQLLLHFSLKADDAAALTAVLHARHCVALALHLQSPPP